MLNPCQEREPRVITSALIEKCIDLQYPKGEVGRLLRLEGIPKEEVEEIKFEHLYILKIDHLWVLKSLVKLSMNNNLIEKIEGLETLIHLKELDLSFNKIKKIENIETLTNLEKITFYENLIETIENMDNQKKLTVFSIGKNRISGRENVNYFRRYPDLTSLNMAENPCSEEKDFRYYIAAFLPKLVYYEYKRIDDGEREKGILLFDSELRTLEKEEETLRAERDKIEKELRDEETHAKMFVEHLNSGKLFDMMYENDPEGKALLELGEEVTEFYEEYKNQFMDYCKQAYAIGEKHYYLRQTEIDNFFRSVSKAKKENQDESIGHIEQFLEKKSDTMTIIRSYRVQLDHDAIDNATYQMKTEGHRKDFKDIVHQTWKNLMRLELRLYEQMEEVNQTIGRVLEELINTFIEEVQAVFTNIRAAEVTYSENLNDAALRYLTAINLNPDEEIPESLKEITSDRDVLANALVATHDMHMQTIDSREDLLIHKAKGWLESFVTDLTKGEITRNRQKLLEINHFLDIQQEEFNEFSAVQEINIAIDE
ncbi:dynein regulatory complex subunit 3-like [Rhynchophorus ferrugineus]|uniref:Dynein axonemal assembly factor 1 homolog n=1 Tax=Rhynchophorus ferrugineus TaxID=354439 RepID=A0A834I2I7_RHYFE|nr:hypothetical protein GWI33_015451 [Rhynchophorus ferrugineus]